MVYKTLVPKGKPVRIGLRTLAQISVLLQCCASNSAQNTPRKCPPRPVANVPAINSWSDLKHLLETSTTGVVLPSFQIAKSDHEPPALLNHAITISCVAGGACILKSLEDGGAGTFFEIKGEHANMRIQGITFQNASESAIVVAKHAGALVDDGEQMVCESNFIG